jgi:hypothetical protein
VLFSVALKTYFFYLVKKMKRTVPPTTIGRRKRFTSETTQKEEREAINAALKRLVGEDGFRANGAFGKLSPKRLVENPARDGQRSAPVHDPRSTDGSNL